MIWFCCESCVLGSSRLRLRGNRRVSRRKAVLRSWRTSHGVVMTSTSAMLRWKSARAAARLLLGKFLGFLDVVEAFFFKDQLRHAVLD